MNSFALGSDGIYRCAAFTQFVWQSHGFGTRAGNPTARITLRQIHSDVVVSAQGAADRQYEGDALVANDLNLSIGVRTADCVPILLLDSKNRAIAAVHAGWRGTAAAIVQRTLLKMQADFGTLPADVFAAIGPCICQCCYEVGAEVADRCSTFFPEWLDNPGKRHLNLPEANRRQLIGAGVEAENISSAELCTACQVDTFFSFRREPANPGRLLSSIVRLS